MLSLLSTITIAQAVTTSPLSPTTPIPGSPLSPSKLVPPQELIPPQERLQPLETLQIQEVFQPQEIRPLPGQLDTVPVFNSNSPEIVQTEGVLLSTFPPTGMRDPSAHLNFPFQGRFDIFSHHISRARTPSETRTLFQGLMIYNPNDQLVKINILQGASYLTRPDALFLPMPSYVDDPLGNVYAGPGSRVMNDLLRGRRQGNWIPDILLPAGHSQMLMNLPIPAGTSAPTSNGRSTLLRLWSSGPVYIANLAMFAPLNPDGTERVPTLQEWQNLLINSGVAGPRDIPPTPMEQQYSRVTYGRVAGVAIGSQWQAKLTDSPKVDYLSIPRRGWALSYGLSTLYRGTLGTGQVQSAKLLVRYPDTAYQAHGNYGIHYSLKIPLHNHTRERQTVSISIQTPIKADKVKGGLLFFQPPEDRVFFRGPVRIQFTDDRGVVQTRYIHVVQQRGQEGEPLVTLTMPPGDRRIIEVELLYPPDSTPPQVLTITTLRNP
jgi:hypothetical protein